MNESEVQLQFNLKRLPQRRYRNSITINIDKIHENQTGQQTKTESNLFNFGIRSTSHDHINNLLHDRLVNFRWLCEYLTTRISMVATDIVFGLNGFDLTINIKIITSSDKKARLKRLVLRGRLDEDELKSLKMETDEPCSICLENLSDSNPSFPTRMICSHVFHDCCLLDWLQRKNTCPLCRTVLYDR